MLRNLRILLLSCVFYLHSVVTTLPHVNKETTFVKLTVESYSFSTGKEWKTKELNITGCLSSVRQHGQAYSTISNALVLSGCINLYNNRNCKGDFISRTSSHLVDFKGWSDGVSHFFSIGLCGQEFFPDDIYPSWPVDRTPFVTFEKYDSTMTLEIRDCLDLPKAAHTVKSIYFNNTVCIELHEGQNCTGQRVKLRIMTSPRMVGLTWESNAVRSVSPCRINDGSVRVEQKFMSPGPGFITLFEEEDFQGGYTHIDISQGCQEAVDEYGYISSKEWRSIWIYGEGCVLVHSLPSCSNRSTNTQMFLLNQTNLDMHAKLPLKLKSVKQCHQTESTQLYVIIDNRGQLSIRGPALVDVTSCYSSFVKASKIYTYNGCLNIYQLQGCVGPYLTLYEGTTIKPRFFWGSQRTAEDNYVGSVGPCECDPRSMEGRYTDQGSTVVTLYDSKDNRNNVTIAVEGCHVIPRTFQRQVNNMILQDNIAFMFTCLQLHEFWNCSGRSIEHGGLKRQYRDLMKTGEGDHVSTLHVNVLNWDGPFSSMSHCAYRCNLSRMVPTYPRWLSVSPGLNIVTLFDEVHYNGNSINLNLTFGCVDIRVEFPEWNGQCKSIRTFKQCVIVYSVPACTTSRNYGRRLLLNNSELQTAEIINFPVKSIKMCDNESAATDGSDVYFINSMQSQSYNEPASVLIQFRDGIKELFDNITLNITNCLSPVFEHHKLDAKISNTLVLSGCVNLYRRLHCKGDFISKPFGLLVDLKFWSASYDDEVYSIGLCSQEFYLDEIDPSWPVNRTPIVTIERKDAIVTMEVKECNVFPKSDSTVEALSFDNTVCIELHEEENCTGRSVKYREILSPRQVKMTWEWNTIKSVSSCRYSGGSGSAVDNFQSPGPGIITLFEEESFHGGYRHINIGRGCQEAVDEDDYIFPGKWRSILTYDEECVSIHALPSCFDPNTTSQMLLLSQSNLAVHSKIPFHLKSVKRCQQTKSSRLYTMIKIPGRNWKTREMPSRMQLRDVTGCYSYFANTLEASDLYTYNGCLNIYKLPYCKGPFLTLNEQKTTIQTNFHWTSDDTDQRSYVRSVGPCECDPRSTETRYDAQGYNVATLFDSVDDKNSTNATVHIEECHLIPRILQRKIKDVTFRDEYTCIQLHEFWNCTGRSMETGVLRREYNVLNDEGSFPISTSDSSVLNWDDSFSSISRCSYRCNVFPSVQSYRRTNAPSPGINIVTLFDEFDYNGNSVNLNLTDGCVEVRDEFPEWEGQGKSVLTFQQCVIIYDKLGCRTFRDYGRMNLLNISNSRAGNVIDFPVKSIKMCHQESDSTPMTPSVNRSIGGPTNVQWKFLNSCIFFENYTTENVDASENCLNIYEEAGCRGVYVALKNEEKHVNIFWKKGDENSGSARSIGPCECDPRSVEIRYKNVLTSVTLYDSVNKQGNNVKIDIEGCKVIPRKLRRRVESIEFHPPTEYNCVQLHQFWNCTGQSFQYGNDSRQRQNLSGEMDQLGHLYVIPFSTNWDSVSSISNCDYDCKTSEIKELNRSSPGPNIVRIFDEPDFNGNYEDLNLSNGCLNITEEWEGQFQSILLFYECVMIHSSRSCDKFSEYLPLNYSNSKIQAQFSVPWTVRSIKLCQEEALVPYNVTLAVVVPILALLAVAVTVASVMFIRLRRINDKLNEKEIQDFMTGRQNVGIEDCDGCLGQTRPYDQSYEIPKELLNIDFGVPLGSGAFAVVYKGRVIRPSGTDEFEVAVKTVKPYSSIEHTRALLKEIKTMIYVGNHDRILGLVGCCTKGLQNGELYLMTELCGNGCMEKFLRSNRERFVNLIEKGTGESNFLQTEHSEKMEPISPDYFNTVHLMEWCLQIAEGMDYLATKKVIHGDLAARNVLLHMNFNIKISDFGLSRQLYQYSEYIKKSQAPLPWKWLAIETLKSKIFSTESDVWAFGVTVWEIFSLGDIPFPDRIWSQDFLDSLTDGLRLSQPKTAPNEWYNIILECWREIPSDRITFPDLRMKITGILQKWDTSRPIYTDI